MLIPVLFDICWSPMTQRLYVEGQELGPSTYERPYAVSYFSSTMPPRYLSPIDYATFETAARVQDWAEKNFPALRFSTIAGDQSGVSFPKLYLVAEAAAGGKTEVYSAGWRAFVFDKNGPAAAKTSFEAELRLAGLV